MQVIYIDMLFLLNTVMNFLIFYIALRVSNVRILKRRVVLASILSSVIYCLGIIVPVLRQIPMGIYQIFIPTLSVLYLFRCITIRDFLKRMILVNSVAWIVGGAAFNIYYRLQMSMPGEKCSIYIPIVAGIIITCLVELSYAWIRRSWIEPRYTYEMFLTQDDRTLNVKAYLDTGNTLYTLNHHPVILIEYDEVIKIISREYQVLVEQFEGGLGIEQLLETEKRLKFYLIPFTSVGCQNSMIIGLPIDYIELRSGNCTKNIKNAVVGVCYHNLFKDKRYNALIHPDLVL